jgi:hypothetical protein
MSSDPVGSSRSNGTASGGASSIALGGTLDIARSLFRWWAKCSQLRQRCLYLDYLRIDLAWRPVAGDARLLKCVRHLEQLPTVRARHPEF